MSDNDVYLAKEIATKAHEGQFRRDGVTPYITHPERVAELCVFDDQKTVAWLHDVVEDTNVTLLDLNKAGFHPEIVLAVGALTKDKTDTYLGYLHRVSNTPVARAVKVADMVANLTDSPTEKQIKKYADGLNMLCGFSASELLKQKDEKIRQYQIRLYDISEMVNDGQDKGIIGNFINSPIPEGT